jgi:hypothetical protein
MSMTRKMSASTSSPANCRSAAAATPTTLKQAASSSCPAAARTGFRAKDQPAKLLLITVPGGIEDYFRQINNATTDEERDRIGEQHSIRVVPP